jgi:hypothetical protein
MYFLGDTHGIRPVFNIIDRNKITDSHIIHVGDFGLGFVPLTSDIKNLEATDEMLIDTQNHLYVIRGNHDNPVFWDKSKGLNLPKFHNLHLIDDYEVFEVEGKKILGVGGGISVDRMIRKDDKPPTWWKDEVFTYDPLKINRIANSVDRIDIVVTHSAPTMTYPRGVDAPIVNDWHEVELCHGGNLKGELIKEREDIQTLMNSITAAYSPTHWIYGHFHASRTEKININGKRITMKLLNINELYELK